MARGTRLAKEAFAILMDDRRLLLLPATALLMNLLCAGVMLALAASATGRHGRDAVLLVAFVLVLYPVTVCSTFFNVALMHVVSQRWHGHRAGVRDGLLMARSRLGPLAAVKRSSSVVRRRWPESLTGSIAIGGVSGFAIIPGIVVCAAGVVTFKSDLVAGALVLLLGVALVLPVMLYSSATSAIFSLAVWEYATTDVPTGPFRVEDLQHPFQGGKHMGNARRWIGRHVFRR